MKKLLTEQVQSELQLELNWQNFNPERLWGQEEATEVVILDEDGQRVELDPEEEHTICSTCFNSSGVWNMDGGVTGQQGAAAIFQRS